MSDVSRPCLQTDLTDDSCRLEYIEIVPLTRDTDGHGTPGGDSGDWSAEVTEQILPILKLELDDVCCTL